MVWRVSVVVCRCDVSLCSGCVVELWYGEVVWCGAVVSYSCVARCSVVELWCVDVVWCTVVELL